VRRLAQSIENVMQVIHRAQSKGVQNTDTLFRPCLRVRTHRHVRNQDCSQVSVKLFTTLLNMCVCSETWGQWMVIFTRARVFLIESSFCKR